MSGNKVIAMDAHSIVKLWTHYTDGVLPLDAELNAMAVDKLLPRQIAFIVTSKQWQEDPIPGRDEYYPLHLRYEKKRVMSWGNKGDEVFWQNAPDAPKFK